MARWLDVLSMAVRTVREWKNCPYINIFMDSFSGLYVEGLLITKKNAPSGQDYPWLQYFL